MHPKELTCSSENDEAHKDVLCTVIYNSGEILNVQQLDTVQQTVECPLCGILCGFKMHGALMTQRQPDDLMLSKNS